CYRNRLLVQQGGGGSRGKGGGHLAGQAAPADLPARALVERGRGAVAEIGVAPRELAPVAAHPEIEPIAEPVQPGKGVEGPEQGEAEGEEGVEAGGRG